MRSKGFSLVEALVSLVLMAFVLSSVSFILIDTQQASQDVWNRTQRFNNMAVVLESLREDLMNIHLPREEINRTVFFPTMISEGEQRMDGVAFVVRKRGEEGEYLAEVEYLCSPNQEESGFYLYRRYSSKADEDLHQGGFYEKLLGPLESFSLNYGGQEGWIASPEKLPALVSVEMSHQKYSQKLQSTILLPHIGQAKESL
jgi:type II secretory pathway component PulJ